MRPVVQCGLLPGYAVRNAVKFDKRHAELLRYFAAGYGAAARLNHPDHALAKSREFPCFAGPAVKWSAFHFHCSPKVKPISASDSSILLMNSGTISLKSDMYLSSRSTTTW